MFRTSRLAAFGLLAAGSALLLKQAGRDHGNRDSAPGRTARKSRFGDYAVVGKTVAITKPPRAELFAFWRDFTNLPAFMDNVERIDMLGPTLSRWTLKGPGKTPITLETEIAEERDGELIAWRSTDNSDVSTHGRVAFRDAVGGRGTEVELIIAYKPPMGRVGEAVAWLLQREPGMQARRDLRRFKMLMETGEIATSANRPDSGPNNEEAA